MADSESSFDARPIRPSDLDRAERDLEWWHCVAPSALGAHGHGYEGSGAAQWDQSAIGRLFDAVFDRRRVDNVRRFSSVAPVVASLSAEHRALATAIYEPRTCLTANLTQHMRSAFPCDRTDPGVVTLAGAVGHTAALREAYAKALPDRPDPTAADLLVWASDAIRPRVEAGKLTRQKLPHWAAAALAEAREMREGLLRAYVVAARSMG